MDDRWLDAANPADLEALAQCLSDGRVRIPASVGDLGAAGIRSDAGAFLAGFAAVDAGVVAWTLRRLARERRRADDRFARTATLVWSGMNDDGLALRDTRAVLDGLFARAEGHVLVSTFVVYNGRDVFAALGDRLAQRPNLEIELFVNLPADPTHAIDERAATHAWLERFAGEHWPAGLPLPAIYYDPGSLHPDGKRGVLHAKCAVIDGRWALVTSANFTEAAQARNLEAGVLLDHPQLATTLVGRFHALRDAGALRQMR